jgi:hypothetical protein
MMFETGLGNAVEIGGQRMAERVSEAYPGLMLSAVGRPIVQGFVLRPLQLYAFYVQVPDVLETSLQMLSIMPPLPPRARQGGARVPVSSPGGRVAAEDVTPDAMTVSPIVGPTDARREYRSHVRAAIIDAMLDNSRALPLGPSDRLMVVASAAANTSVPVHQRSKQLILAISSEDLTAFREGKITRDEAKRRIVETQF